MKGSIMFEIQTPPPSVGASLRPDGTVLVATGTTERAVASQAHALALIAAVAQRISGPLQVAATAPDVPDETVVVTAAGTYYAASAPSQVAAVPSVDVEARDVEALATAIRPDAAPDRAVELGPPPPPQPADVEDDHRVVELRPHPQPPTSPPAPSPVPAQRATGPGSHRKSFIRETPNAVGAKKGWRGAANRMGLNLQAGEAERREREDVQIVAQHWPGPRTLAVGNPKGSANKTPTTAMLAAVFARYGGSGVLAWDNNETRGSLAWRTQTGAHESTVIDLLPRVDDLLSTSAVAADLSYFTHHQVEDKYDVLRSDQSTAGDHEVSAEDVERVHRVASRFYRLIVMDSGNNERAANWRAMIDRADVLVVPVTNSEDTAEAGARMLEALASRDEKSRRLAQNAVAIVSQRTPGKDPNTERIVTEFAPLVREVVQIPHDPAMRTGIIHFDALAARTQRAWLAAAAAVARGL